MKAVQPGSLFSEFDITARQLQIFLSVVAGGSLTQGGRMVALSQPSVSQQIRKLEQALGTELFERSTSGVKGLTPAGEYWMRAAQDLFRTLDAAALGYQDAFRDRAFQLCMGTLGDLGPVPAALVGRLSSAGGRFAGYEMTASPSSTALASMLRSHAINCAVLPEEAIEAEPGAYARYDIGPDPLMLLMPAEADMNSLAEVVAATHPALARHAVNTNAEAGTMLPVTWYRTHLPGSVPLFRVSDHASAAQIVAAGMATTICPRSAWLGFDRELRSRLRGVVIGGHERRIVLAAHRHLPSVQAFDEFFIAFSLALRGELRRSAPAEAEPAEMLQAHGA